MRTELPWSQDGRYVVGQVPQGRPGGEVIAHCWPTRADLASIVPNEANAAYIVQCCNLFPEMVEALKALTSAAQRPIVAHGETLADLFGPEVERARALLARAEGVA
jgi:hypothetical protein